MTYKLLAAIALALTTVAPAAFAGECEDNFSKSGSIFSGTDFSSRITVPDLSVKDAMGQMRGIMIAEKMDVITEDAETGTMLVEQRSTNTTRAIPTLIAISGEGNAATVQMTVKTEKGQIAKADAMRPYMCQLLAKVKGGKEGVAAAKRGAGADNTEATGNQDVFAFSRMIANEANKNAVAVNARHKGRTYTLSGRIETLMEDGEDYNLIFEVPEIRDMVIKPFPHEAQFKVSVSCLFKPDQLTTVLAMREGQKVKLTGTVMKYDNFRRVIWLENCTKAK